MPTYQVKKCPKCGAAYEKNTYGRHPSKDNRVKYGSPLKMCSKCQNIFIDDEYREIAIDGVRKADTQHISPAGLLYSGISIFASISSFACQYTLGGIIFILIALYLSLRELLTYNIRQQMLKKLTQESEERMKNIQYAQLLKKYGYNVPEKYLL